MILHFVKETLNYQKSRLKQSAGHWKNVHNQLCLSPIVQRRNYSNPKGIFLSNYSKGSFLKYDCIYETVWRELSVLTSKTRGNAVACKKQKRLSQHESTQLSSKMLVSKLKRQLSEAFYVFVNPNTSQERTLIIRSWYLGDFIREQVFLVKRITERSEH